MVVVLFIATHTKMIFEFLRLLSLQLSVVGLPMEIERDQT